MAINWRCRRPILGNVTGGLSGWAIKRLALRLVWQVARVANPVVGVGGIGTIDDAMEFLIARIRAVQIGTPNFFDPTAAVRVTAQLPAALAEAQATRVGDVVGMLEKR